LKLTFTFLRPLSTAIIFAAVFLCNYIEAWAQSTGFLENKGQVVDQNGNRRDDILYLFEQDGFTLALGRDFFSYQLCVPELTSVSAQASNDFLEGSIIESRMLKFDRTDVKILNALKNVKIRPSDIFTDTRNFHNATGSFNNVHSYDRVTYENVYPGIDLVFYIIRQAGKEKARLKYDFIVHGNGNETDIQLSYAGANVPFINEKDELISPLANAGFVIESKPLSYFITEKDSFYVSYQTRGNIVSFAPVQGKNQRVLTIDPEITWSRYLGGVKDEFVEVIEADGTGNIYACGQTYSPMGIVTSGAYQVVKKGPSDCFITKFNQDGAVLWSTYFGGSDGDFAFGMCQDGFGGLYVCGQTNSPSGFGTDGAHQKNYGGSIDGFLAKFSTEGLLSWSTYYGGLGKDQAFSCVANQSGVFVGGYTESAEDIVTPGADQPNYAGAGDAFIAAFSPAGIIKFSTYLGGSDQDRAHDIHLDHFGNLMITGTTPSEDGIALGDVHQSEVGGNSDAFISKYSKTGVKKWSTYFGGLKTERGREIVPDGDGNCYVTGPTGSGLNIATPDAYQVLLNGSGPATDTVYEDAYLAKFDSTGKLLWATYFGGEHDEMGSAMKWLTNGLVVIGGTTLSDSLMSTPDALQVLRGGGRDGFLAIFSEDGRLIWSTYYGGIKDENYQDGYGPAFDIYDNRHIIFGVSSYSAGLGTLNNYTPSSTSIPSSDGLFVSIDIQCLDFYEPNNDFSKATDLETINTITFLEALMNYQHDKDFYRFKKIAGFPLKIKLDNLAQNCDLVLYDSVFNPIRKSNHTGLWGEEITMNAAVSGKFYLRVLSPGGGFSNTCYELSFENMDGMNKIQDTAVDEQQLLLYPNPADQFVSLQFNSLESRHTFIVLTDLSGKVVLQQAIKIREGSNIFELNTSPLSGGTYLLKFPDGNFPVQKLLIY
jgi:hypothetical protein